MPGLAISKPNLQIKIFETYCYNFLTCMQNQVPLLHITLCSRSFQNMNLELNLKFEFSFDEYLISTKIWILSTWIALLKIFRIFSRLYNFYQSGAGCIRWGYGQNWNVRKSLSSCWELCMNLAIHFSIEIETGLENS